MTSNYKRGGKGSIFACRSAPQKGCVHLPAPSNVSFVDRETYALSKLLQALDKLLAIKQTPRLQRICLQYVRRM